MSNAELPALREAAEKGDMAELRRLADAGNQDAADVLAELTDEPLPDDDE